ncbi:MAG TPA: chemotaxis protein CheW [Gemmatimonadaceae bacterium]
MSAPAEAVVVRDGLKGGKFLTFFLAGEEYGLEILKVHEIIGMLPITRVPRTPEYVRGVINLRGKVIPIMDLRRKFGMDHGGAESCIIVVQLRGIQIGIVVDAVSEVASIAAADIEPSPTFGADVSTDFLLGLAKSNDRVRLLLDIERALSSDELDTLQVVSDAAR